MSQRGQHSQLVWTDSRAGFGGRASFAVIHPEPMYRLPSDHPLSARTIVDQTPCLLDCGDPDCREWTDLFTLHGDSRKEAIQNLIAREYSGIRYHVSECHMYDRPQNE